MYETYLSLSLLLILSLSLSLLLILSLSLLLILSISHSHSFSLSHSPQVSKFITLPLSFLLSHYLTHTHIHTHTHTLHIHYSYTTHTHTLSICVSFSRCSGSTDTCSHELSFTARRDMYTYVRTCVRTYYMHACTRTYIETRRYVQQTSGYLITLEVLFIFAINQPIINSTIKISFNDSISANDA